MKTGIGEADASVVVKWFVKEPLSEESRLLLAHRLHLYAPDHRVREHHLEEGPPGEIPDSGPYFAEFAAIAEIVDLLPDTDVIERAAAIAVDIGHPVYDCLYLACAEASASVLITADRKLVAKSAGRLSNVDVRYPGNRKSHATSGRRRPR